MVASGPADCSSAVCGVQDCKEGQKVGSGICHAFAPCRDLCMTAGSDTQFEQQGTLCLLLVPSSCPMFHCVQCKVQASMARHALGRLVLYVTTHHCRIEACVIPMQDVW